MTKILFITPVMPDHNGGGIEKRAHMWTKRLSGDGMTDVLVVANDNPREIKDGLDGKLGDTFFISTGHQEKNQLLQIFTFPFFALNNLFGGSKCPKWRSGDRRMRQELAEIYSGRHYDKIFVFRLRLLDYGLFLKRLVGARRLETDFDDFESTTWIDIGKLLFSEGRWLPSLTNILVALQFFLMEAVAVKKSDIVYLCSEEDRQKFIQRFPKADIAVVPNKLPATREQASSPTKKQRKRILFVGSLHHYPNDEAVRWFGCFVLPELRKKDKDWTFVVAGRNPTRELTNFANQTKGLVLKADLPDLTDEYAKCSMVVAPIHAGGGTSLKVIEAMTKERPLVATGKATRGLQMVDGIYFLKAEKAAEFVEQCELLDHSPEIGDGLAERAKKLAADGFTY